MKNPFHPHSTAGKCFQEALGGNMREYEEMLSKSDTLADTMLSAFTGEPTPRISTYLEVVALSEFDEKLKGNHNLKR